MDEYTIRIEILMEEQGMQFFSEKSRMPYAMYPFKQCIGFLKCSEKVKLFISVKIQRVT